PARQPPPSPYTTLFRSGPSLYTLPARGELPTHVPAKSQAQQIPAQRWTHPSPAGGPAHDERAWLGKATSSPSGKPRRPRQEVPSSPPPVRGERSLNDSVLVDRGPVPVVPDVTRPK